MLGFDEQNNNYNYLLPFHVLIQLSLLHFLLEFRIKLNPLHPCRE